MFLLRMFRLMRIIMRRRLLFFLGIIIRMIRLRRSIIRRMVCVRRVRMCLRIIVILRTRMCGRLRILHIRISLALVVRCVC